MGRGAAGALLAAACLATFGAVYAQPTPWALQTGEVRVTCPLTVGGSFEGKSSAITGDYRPAADAAQAGQGSFVVDLSSIDTGIAVRDQHMRETYLEIGKGKEYARAVMSQIRLTGINPSTLDGRGTFTAMLRLHGVERAVTGRAALRRTGNKLVVRASFPVTLPQFGIAKPRYLGVGVKDDVTVQVSFEAQEGEVSR